MPYFGAPYQVAPLRPVARRAVFVGRKRLSVAYPSAALACAVVFTVAFTHLEIT
jgi:hypothetical protein